jgi:hypothetical protein
MIRLWAILFGLAVAIAAGVVVKTTFAKASAQFERHIQAGPEDLEAATRQLSGSALAGGGNLVRSHRHLSSLFLSQVRKGDL